MRTVFAAFILLYATCNPTVAQQPEKGSERIIDKVFEGDINKDGKIGKNEVDQSLLERFDLFDANGDGFLTREEMGGNTEKGQRGKRRNGGERGEGPLGTDGRRGGGPGQLMAMLPVMMALDVNKDGELSSQEVANAVKALQSLDRDGDGVLAEGELMPDFSQMGRGGTRGRNGSTGGRPDRGGGEQAPQGRRKGSRQPDFGDSE